MIKKNDGISKDDICQNQFTAYVVLAVKRKRQSYIKKKQSDNEKENRTKKEAEQSEFRTAGYDMWSRMEPQNDSIESNRFAAGLFILTFACDVTFEANAPHMTETLHNETVWTDAIVDFQNLIGLQLHRKQLRQRVSLGLLCKFHRRIRGFALVFYCIAAGVWEKRDSVGRKHALSCLDFR